jgi:hypothetical protein
VIIFKLVLAEHMKVEKFVVTAPVENTEITYENGKGAKKKFLRHF